MTEIIRTAGRNMSGALQEAIDACPNRRLTTAVFEQRGREGGPLAPLYAALALELNLAELRERDTLRNMTLDLAVGDELPPPPAATGPAMFLDPDTRELRPLE